MGYSNLQVAFALLLGAAASLASSAACGQTGVAAKLVDLPGRHLSVAYTAQTDTSSFVATIPKDWSLWIMVDGDQDGRWGTGPLIQGSPLPAKTADLAFTITASQPLCTTYVLASAQANSDSFGATTQCGVFKSKAVATTSKPDEKGLVEIRLDIPNGELFASKSDAHLVLLFWDGRSFVPFNPLSAPLIVKRKAG